MRYLGYLACAADCAPWALVAFLHSPRVKAAPGRLQTHMRSRSSNPQRALLAAPWKCCHNVPRPGDGASGVAYIGFICIGFIYIHGLYVYHGRRCGRLTGRVRINREREALPERPRTWCHVIAPSKKCMQQLQDTAPEQDNAPARYVGFLLYLGLQRAKCCMAGSSPLLDTHVFRREPAVVCE